MDNGVDVVKAAIHAAQMRFRPILMTSLAFVLGMLPMVLASGPGSASRHSIGTGVFFGMLVAITVGIVLVPFFFVLIYKIKGKMRMERIAQKKRSGNLYFKENTKTENYDDKEFLYSRFSSFLCWRSLPARSESGTHVRS